MHLKNMPRIFTCVHVMVCKLLSWGPESNAYSQGHRAGLRFGKRLHSTQPLIQSVLSQFYFYKRRFLKMGLRVK